MIVGVVFIHNGRNTGVEDPDIEGPKEPLLAGRRPRRSCSWQGPIGGPAKEGRYEGT